MHAPRPSPQRRRQKNISSLLQQIQGVDFSLTASSRNFSCSLLISHEVYEKALVHGKVGNHPGAAMRVLGDRFSAFNLRPTAGPHLGDVKGDFAQQVRADVRRRRRAPQPQARLGLLPPPLFPAPPAGYKVATTKRGLSRETCYLTNFIRGPLKLYHRIRHRRRLDEGNFKPVSSPRPTLCPSSSCGSPTGSYNDFCGRSLTSRPIEPVQAAAACRSAAQRRPPSNPAAVPAPRNPTWPYPDL